MRLNGVGNKYVINCTSSVDVVVRVWSVAMV